MTKKKGKTTASVVKIKCANCNAEALHTLVDPINKVYRCGNLSKKK